MEPIRALIADDNPLVRQGLRSRLALEKNLEIVGEAADGEEAVQLVDELRPDIVIMDARMPKMDGVEATRRIKQRYPDTAIVFLSMDDVFARQALANGATGYVLKDAPPEELQATIFRAYSATVFPADWKKLNPFWRQVLAYLLEQGTINYQQLEEILRTHRQGKKLVNVLVEDGYISDDLLDHAISDVHRLDHPHLEVYQPEGGRGFIDPVDPRAAQLVREDLARKRDIIPILAIDGTLIVAMADPSDEVAISEVVALTGLTVKPVAAPLTEIHAAIDRAYKRELPAAVERPAHRPPKARALPKIGLWPRSWAVRPFDILVGTTFIVLLLIGLNYGMGGFSFGRAVSFISLMCGMFFFLYALKYYTTVATVLVSSSPVASNGNGHNGNGNGKGVYRTLTGQYLDEKGQIVSNGEANGNGKKNGNGNGNGHIHLSPEEQPFVSIHLATYNERYVIDRLLSACTSLDYEKYEVIVADDSTDATVQILEKWKSHPRIKVIHRPNRKGFKGGALQEALRHTDPSAEYVVVYDADFVPPPDAIWSFLDYFYRKSNGNGNGHSNGNGNGNGHSNGKANGNGHSNGHNGYGRQYYNGNLAVVQGYQWHMLNAGENWITRGVRSEFSGSYVLERSGQELFGSMKMISGSVYMIRADVLRELGWGTSITEDWELTLRLYLKGYKVLYTPYIQAPAECVSTLPRLIRQRMRWAEGHTFNVKKYFLQVLRSPNLTLTEKLEFVYYAPYYLQAVLFSLGTVGWLVSDLVLHQPLPYWTALLGWSLVFSNLFALPLMNLAGLFMEGSVKRDAGGILSFIALSYILLPFQAYAALKALFEKEEGGWHRTMKSGRITETLGRFHLTKRFGWLLPGRVRRRLRGLPLLGGVVGSQTTEDEMEAMRQRPKVQSSGRLRFKPAPVLTVLGSIIIFATLALTPLVPVVLAAPDTFYLRTGAINDGLTLDTTAGASATTLNIGKVGNYYWYSITLPTGSDDASIAAGDYTFHMDFDNTLGAAQSIQFTVYVELTNADGTGAATIVSSASQTINSSSTSPLNISMTGGAAQTITAASPKRIRLRIDVTTGVPQAGRVRVRYNGAAGGTDDSNLQTPSVVVPEGVLGLAPLALAIPLLGAALRRRRGGAPLIDSLTRKVRRGRGFRE